jgi:hypothetical protein
VSAAALASALALGLGQMWSSFGSAPAPTRAQMTACLAQPQASARRWREDAVFFCGRMTEQSVAAFRETLRPTDHTLFITSFGGDLDAPLDMAELVRDRALHVIVVGPCLSGCASFVFIAARRRTVAAAGVLGLHNTNSSALLLARGINGGAVAARDRPLETRATREEYLYRSVNVSPALLLEPQVRLETLCVAEDRPDTRTGETRFLIHSRYGLWTPTRAQWNAFGVGYVGNTPTSTAQAQRLIDASMPRDLRAGASVTLNRLPLPAPPATYLSDVGSCGRRATGGRL